MPEFADRTEAGQLLARKLLRFKGEHPVVLALPRGGVPIGLEVALALDAPLDLVLVRKIGAPFQKELAVASVAEGAPPVLALNQDVITALGVPEEYVHRERDRQLAEIARRRALYLRGRKPIEVADRTVIVVDDGIATGATMRAALDAVRRRGPARLVLAVPVAAPETLETFRPLVDNVIALATPRWFGAIGVFYRDFRQLDDRDVIDLLDKAPPDRGGPPPPFDRAARGNG